MSQDRENQVMVVTGANSGLGLATTIALARTGATVIMLCRDEKRGRRALRKVKESVKDNHVYLMLADLADLDSVASFSDRFHDRFDRLDVLINNAGVILPNRRETKQGMEMQFGVNHIGHFLLTLLLSDLLSATDAARVVIVTSGAHKAGKIHFDDLQLEKHYHVMKGYAQSKLANLLFARKLAEWLQDTDTSVNCCHPGAVATNMGINRVTGFGKTITGLLKPFFQSAEKGAETQVALALTDLGAKNEAAYYHKMKKASTSKRANSQDAADKLWRISIDLTKAYLPDTLLSRLSE